MIKRTNQQPAAGVPTVLLDKSGVSNLTRGDSEEIATYVILQKLPSRPIILMLFVCGIKKKKETMYFDKVKSPSCLELFYLTCKFKISYGTMTLQ